MGIKVLVSNRKAYHEYEIGDKFEAGIVLTGTEVKSIRSGKISIKEGWVNFENDEAYLQEVYISHYTHGNIFNHEEQRRRKLLLNRKELIKLQSAVNEKGFSIVPTKVYLKGQLVKIEIALAKGKKLYDKRQSSKKKDADREMERAIKRY